MDRKRIVGATLCLLSVLLLLSLFALEGRKKTYSDYLVTESRYEEIKNGRTESDELLTGLVFDEEYLIYDQLEHTYYYSLVEGNPSAWDPKITMKSSRENVQLAFLEQPITKESVESNQTFSFLAYDENSYTEYFLKCTTLPLMNISCGMEITEENAPMQVTLFDNRKEATSRVMVSDGVIHIRGNTTKIFPKKGYRFQMIQDSIGGHIRFNQQSLLGMRQDDDWLLYAAYNDQEKIRNVFSANLWEESCAYDNEAHVNAGLEYQYLELFLNGSYAGLYALGYPVDEKQLMLDQESVQEGLYKVINWFPDGGISFTEGGNVVGYRIKGTVNEARINWEPLLQYYYQLSDWKDDDQKLKTGIDLNNAIDTYLFLNLIQGLDHVMSGKYIKNLYLAIYEGEEGLTALYVPWDMDITWGNAFINDAALNCNDAYAMPVENNILMHSEYLNQLLVNDADGIWDAVFAKYHDLREGGWSEEAIDQLLDQYEEDIYGSGAYLREMERWPEGSYQDPSEKLNRFREYVKKRLLVLDDYYAALEESHEEGRRAYQLDVQFSTISNLSYYLEGLLHSENCRANMTVTNPEAFSASERALMSELLKLERIEAEGFAVSEGVEKSEKDKEEGRIRIVVFDMESGEKKDEVVFSMAGEESLLQAYHFAE